MRPLLPLCTAVLLLAGCYDASFGEKEQSDSGATPSADIRTLRQLYTGTTTRIEGDISIVGRVTTSDRNENFYRTFCIEQDGAGLEIMAGIDHLHNDFPEGCRVTLHLEGLAIGQSHGVLQIGRMPAPGSGFATDYIGSKAALDTYLHRTGEQIEHIQPARHTIGSLSTELCGTLICITGVRYTPEELTQNSWAGYVRFTDDTGAEIFSYVRPYASFAENPVPQGVVALTGILQYDGADEGRYTLKLRDEDDCVD